MSCQCEYSRSSKTIKITVNPERPILKELCHVVLIYFGLIKISFKLKVTSKLADHGDRKTPNK